MAQMKPEQGGPRLRFLTWPKDHPAIFRMRKHMLSRQLARQGPLKQGPADPEETG